ncbi:MAG: ribonuclease H-like domain-containing protein [Vicinamibacterales bacterium]
MASLTDRLRGIVGGAVPRLSPDLMVPAGEAAHVPADTTAARSAGLREPAMARAAEVLGGRVVATRTGAIIAVDRHYGSTERHGRVAIGDIVATLLDLHDARALLARASHSRREPDSRFQTSAFAKALADKPGSRDGSLWFLDLETTGLAGGAGTQAFLVGCACISRDGVSVRQFLLPGYEHERALLAEVGDWAAERGAIVTFNGKSFDVPLIETRYLFHRVPFPLEGVPHVDMLHPARRLWRARGTLEGSGEASCSLGTLERLLGGVHRVGDVPGFEIPSRYFQFVRDGDARPLEAVLEHNRLDLVSLALVMARALTLVDRGPGSARDGYECLGLARLYDRAGRLEEAEAAYVRAVEMLLRVGRDPEATGEALRRLAYCRRRAGRTHEAAVAWQRLADLPRCPAALRCEAREALAIFHEHRAHDLAAARAHAERLLVEQPSGRRRDEAEHRLRRIERKLERERSSSSLLLDPDA